MRRIACAAHRPPHRKKRKTATPNAKLIVIASKKVLGNKAQGAAKTIVKRYPGTRQNPAQHVPRPTKIKARVGAWDPKSIQEVAQTSQEMPESRQVRPKSRPRAAQGEPRIGQKRPKAGQETPKGAPDSSKTESNELQDRVGAPFL